MTGRALERRQGVLKQPREVCAARASAVELTCLFFASACSGAGGAGVDADNYPKPQTIKTLKP